jgi:hypothetical protein
LQGTSAKVEAMQDAHRLIWVPDQAPLPGDFLPEKIEVRYTAKIAPNIWAYVMIVHLILPE